MKILEKVAVALAFFLLAACSGSDPVAPQRQTPAAPVAKDPLGDDEVLSRIAGLNAQVLTDGQCSLFLWMKRDDAPLVFFQRSDGQAVMAIDGEERPLSRLAMTDRIAMEFYEHQHFSAGTVDVKVMLEPEATRSLQKGLKIPVASLAVTVAGGWSATVPAVGLVGCK